MVLLACGSDGTPGNGRLDLTSADGSSALDRGADQAPDLGGDLAVDSGPAVIEPRDYCERLVDPFCAFYLRCGRMAVQSEAECREVFLETCNTRYEPQYLALVEAGLLELSAEVVVACEQHLATVQCGRQIRDLDGPCAMWVGRQPAPGACGLGIQSLVCDPRSTCALRLDLCGTCKPLAPVGERCDAETICGNPADCVGGQCVARALAGDPCGGAVRCITGARCESDVCVPPAFVGEGQTCNNSDRRCQYLTSCIGGFCRRNARMGQPCGELTPCDAGRCAAGAQGSRCEAPLAGGAPCGDHWSCLSGRCNGGFCDPIPGTCFDAS
jgi:hypothetical protein